jgi:pyridoxal 5'-phosphate synthase pdxS subunit
MATTPTQTATPAVKQGLAQVRPPAPTASPNAFFSSPNRQPLAAPSLGRQLACAPNSRRGRRWQMLKGGVIMDVVNAEQARIAEEAGAVAVMALERVPADIRADGGVARMSDPGMIKAIMAAVTIPVMAKVRIGHFVEAQIIEAVGVDYIDESEVLTPADEELHVNKHKFKVRRLHTLRPPPPRLVGRERLPPSD